MKAPIGFVPSLLFATALAGCDPQEVISAPDSGTVYVQKSERTSFHGFVFDPEAFFFSANTCKENCGGGQVTLLGSDHFRRSAVPGATFTVLDEAGKVRGTSPSTDQQGAFNMEPLEVEDRTPLFTTVSPPQGPFTPPPATADDPAIPPSELMTTRALRTLDPQIAHCIVPQQALVSRNGVLEAVLKYLAAQGIPLTHDDLVNPALFGGVGVWWAYAPGAAFADAMSIGGVSMEVSQGDVLYLDWAPPQHASLPANVKSIQSERGFYVADGATETRIGVAVILVPPVEPAAPIRVNALFRDNAQSATARRPWVFDRASFDIHPGVISHGAIRAMVKDEPREVLDPALCVPPDGYLQ